MFLNCIFNFSNYMFHLCSLTFYFNEILKSWFTYKSRHKEKRIHCIFLFQQSHIFLFNNRKRYVSAYNETYVLTVKREVCFSCQMSYSHSLLKYPRKSLPLAFHYLPINPSSLSFSFAHDSPTKIPQKRHTERR